MYKRKDRMMVKERLKKKRIEKEKEKIVIDIKRNAERKWGKDKRIVIWSALGL